MSSRGREEKLREAAMLHMRLGEVQRYCELMVELGEVSDKVKGQKSMVNQLDV